jgi:hypothetical protein
LKRPDWQTAFTIFLIGVLGTVLICSLLALPIPSLALQIFYSNYAKLGIGEPLSVFGWCMLIFGMVLSLFGILICAAIKSFYALGLVIIGSIVLGLCFYAGIVNVLYAALSSMAP